jgi:flagellar motor switch protein FliN/FliY
MKKDAMVNSLISSLTKEFAAALEAMTGGAVSVPPAGGARGDGWNTTITASGSATGSVGMWVIESATVTLVNKVLGTDDAPDAATTADMLRELWSQSAGSVVLMDEFKGLSLSVGVPEKGTPGPGAASYELQLVDGPAGFVAGWGEVTPVKAAESAPAAEIAIQAASTAVMNPKLEVVLDIDLPLIVRFGRTVMTMKALSSLGPGSIVDMGRSPDEPCEMLVSDKVIARGEVVIVGGNYGIRITDLVSPAERVRALEA